MLHPKGKTPSRSCILRKGVLFSAYGPSAIRQATCKCSRTLHLLRRTEQKKKYTPLGNTPLPIKWAGKAAKPLYHSFRQKDTGNDAVCQSLSLWERCRRRRRRGQARRERAAAQRWAGSLSERYYRSVWDSPSAALPSQSHFVRQLSQRESLCLRALREFVENARQKREEFVKVIKMRRRY